MDDFVLNALRLARRPMTQAELAALRFGPTPNDAQRKQVMAACRRLDAQRLVNLSTALVLNARGQQREQNMVDLAAEQAEPPPWQLEDDLLRASRTPDALAVNDGDGNLIGWDESAAHEYIKSVGLPSDCDDGCANRGHVAEL